MRGPGNPQMPETIETDGDRAGTLIKRHVQIYAQGGYLRSFERIRGERRKRLQALLGLRQHAGQELAFTSMQLQRKRKFALMMPAVLRQQPRTGREIMQRRGVCSRGLG